MNHYAVTFAVTFKGHRLGDRILMVASTNDITARYDALDNMEARGDGAEYTVKKVEAR